MQLLNIQEKHVNELFEASKYFVAILHVSYYGDFPIDR